MLPKLQPTIPPFLLFLLLPISTIAQPAPSTFPCNKFWPTIPPDDHNLVVPCSYFPGYPTLISGIPISVIYTTDVTATPESSPLLDAILRDTFTTTIATYSSLGLPSGFPEIVLVITNSTHDSYTLVTNQPEFPPSSPCRIIAYSHWLSDLPGAVATSLEDTDPGPAQQKLAHEICHCVQRWNMDLTGPLPFPSWVIEGSAMYFSNLAYPSVDIEWADSTGYNPDIPLYMHDEVKHAKSSSKSAYATGLWFQSLEDTVGPVGINSFVLTSTLANGQAGSDDERSRLSSNVIAVLGFNDFAEKYSLGRAFSSAWGVGIKDTNGRYIPTTGGSLLPAALALQDKEGKEGRIDIATAPFTVSEFVFAVDGGQIVMVSLLAGTKPKAGKVKYRVGDQKEWLDVPMGGGGWSSSGFIVTPCDESVAVFLLFVSTGDVEVDKSTVVVKQFYKDEDCPCKNGKKRKGAGLNDGCDKKEEPKPEEPDMVGSCAGSNIPTDECFMSTRKWTLDIPSTKQLVEKKLKETMPKDAGVTGIVVGVTGSGEFVIAGDEGKNVTMTYNNLKIETVVTVSGMNFPVTVKIDGVAEANMLTEEKDRQGGGRVCLVMYAGHGSAVGSNPLIGDVVKYDLAAKDWISQDWDVTYTCGGGQFSIIGVLKGQTKFGPFVYNAVA